MQMKAGWMPMLASVAMAWFGEIGTASAQAPFIVQPAGQSVEIDFALERLSAALAPDRTLVVDRQKEADLVLFSADNPDPDGDDGFSLRRDQNRFSINAQNNRGVMYGILELTAQLENGTPLTAIREQAVQAQFPFRAIKFNLPWYSYRDGEHLALHTETCRDLTFWEAFLDMMVENKFNVLSLWNMHPYIYMVIPEHFPEASPFTPEEMAEWQSFWHGLFAMARERGIETYVVNWNIFVSPEFAKHYGGGDQSRSDQFIGAGVTSPEIEQYTRELVTQTLNEYPDLTGIGFALGERMGEMEAQERADWVDRTLIAGLKAADRKARLIYRAPLSADKGMSGSSSVRAEQITRNAIEQMELDDDVFVEFKFNWSHGHTSPRLSIVHGGMLTDTYWTPPSDKYKAIWTMRNEDFFVLRWAQPDFIRDFIRLNSQPYTGGCFIGSECYIPAKDYISRPEYQQWDYAFQRQWLFYKVWGNLLYNPQTSDATFAQALEKRFPGVDGHELLKAWTLASNSANRLGSFYRATWDGTLYSEGFAGGRGKLISLAELLKRRTLDEALYLSVDEVVNHGVTDPARITPLQLADQLDVDCAEALRLAHQAARMSDSAILAIELNDIRCWTLHGRYFAEKLRGSMALARFIKTGDPALKDDALTHMMNCKALWLELVDAVETYNQEVIPYQFDKTFSWRKQLQRVDADIEFVKNAKMQEGK
jgi:hypothetical protein